MATSACVDSDFSDKGERSTFADHVYNYDNVVGFDIWQLKMLNRVNEDLEEEAARREEEAEEHAEAIQRAKEVRAAQFKSDYKKS